MFPDMKLEDALIWYQRNRFTADDVTRAELQKLGLLSPVLQETKTRLRLLTSHMVKRAALIAPLNKAGLSLAVAGRIVCAAPMLEDLEFDIVDPWHMFYEFDHELRMFQPRKFPHPRAVWFAPDQMLATANDFVRLEVIDSHYVNIRIGESGGTYGELTRDLTDFVWWENAMYDHLPRVGGEAQLSVLGVQDHLPAPPGSFSKGNDPKTLRFSTKTVTEEDERAARGATKSHVSMLIIDVEFALRVALRRLLYVDKPQPDA